jgi:hypothetical protein
LWWAANFNRCDGVDQNPKQTAHILSRRLVQGYFSPVRPLKINDIRKELNFTNITFPAQVKKKKIEFKPANFFHGNNSF